MYFPALERNPRPTRPQSVKKAKLSSKIDYGVLAACLGGGEEGSDGEGMAGDADW